MSCIVYSVLDVSLMCVFLFRVVFSLIYRRRVKQTTAAEEDKDCCNNMYALRMDSIQEDISLDSSTSTPSRGEIHKSLFL